MPLQRKSLFVILLFALVIVGVSFYCFSENAQPKVLSSGEGDLKSETLITVYVCGAVNKPGVIEIEARARVADAVRLCGGLLPVADAEKINMAQPLKDGAQITVPEKIMAAAAPESLTTPARQGAAVAAERININTAGLAELDRLPGIGPALAEAIVEYRNTEGMFQSPEDLMKVKGIGEAKFNKMKSKVTL